MGDVEVLTKNIPVEQKTIPLKNWINIHLNAGRPVSVATINEIAAGMGIDPQTAAAVVAEIKLDPKVNSILTPNPEPPVEPPMPKPGVVP